MSVPIPPGEWVYGGSATWDGTNKRGVLGDALNPGSISQTTALTLPAGTASVNVSFVFGDAPAESSFSFSFSMPGPETFNGSIPADAPGGSPYAGTWTLNNPLAVATPVAILFQGYGWIDDVSVSAA